MVSRVGAIHALQTRLQHTAYPGTITKIELCGYTPRAFGACVILLSGKPGIRRQHYPAQQDSLATLVLNPSAASFNPSTVVRYGKIVWARSAAVMPCLMATASV